MSGGPKVRMETDRLITIIIIIIIIIIAYYISPGNIDNYWWTFEGLESM